MYSFKEIQDVVVQAPGIFDFRPWDATTVESIQKNLHYASFMKELDATVHQAIQTPVPPLPYSLWRTFKATGERRPYERPYFERRARLAAFVLARVLNDREDVLDPLQDLIWEICEEYTWVLPAHYSEVFDGFPEEQIDLFAAETAHALAETLHWLEEDLEPAVRHRIREELERRIFNPLLTRPKRYRWEAMTNNWSAVCGGAVGMAALLQLSDRDKLAALLDRVLRAMDCFLSGYGTDGVCLEGVSYWNYGFGYYVYFAEMLASYSAGELDLFRGEKVRRMAAFPENCRLTENRYVPFSDSAETMDLAPGLTSYLAEKFDTVIGQSFREPAFHRDQCYRWPHLTRNLLWTDTGRFAGAPDEGTVYFADASWVIDRRQMDGVPVVFAAKGGHNDEPHNHNDLGHFIVHVGGDNLLTDLGAGLYTKAYFGDGRYAVINNASRGHSVPILNGQEQPAGRQYRANWLKMEKRPDGVNCELDLTAAYDLDDLIACRRNFAWLHSSEGFTVLEMTDTVEFATAGEVTEVLVSPFRPRLSGDEVRWDGKRGQLILRYDANLLEARLREEEAPDNRGECPTYYFVQLQLRTADKRPRIRLRFECAVKPDVE